MTTPTTPTTRKRRRDEDPIPSGPSPKRGKWTQSPKSRGGLSGEDRDRALQVIRDFPSRERALEDETVGRVRECLTRLIEVDPLSRLPRDQRVYYIGPHFVLGTEYFAIAEGGWRLKPWPGRRDLEGRTSGYHLDLHPDSAVGTSQLLGCWRMMRALSRVDGTVFGDGRWKFTAHTETWDGRQGCTYVAGSHQFAWKTGTRSFYVKHAFRPFNVTDVDYDTQRVKRINFTCKVPGNITEADYRPLTVCTLEYIGD